MTLHRTACCASRGKHCPCQPSGVEIGSSTAEEDFFLHMELSRPGPKKGPGPTETKTPRLRLKHSKGSRKAEQRRSVDPNACQHHQHFAARASTPRPTAEGARSTKASTISHQRTWDEKVWPYHILPHHPHRIRKLPDCFFVHHLLNDSADALREPPSLSCILLQCMHYKQSKPPARSNACLLALMHHECMTRQA